MANTHTELATRLLLVLLTAASSAGYGVTLSVAPQDSGIAPGGTSSFDIRIDGLGNQVAPSLGAFDVGVSFDPSVIAVNSGDVSFGTQLGTSVRDIEVEGGNIRLLEVSLVDPDVLNSEQAGSFTLANVPFEAIQAGTSQLGLVDVTLGDASGSPFDSVVLESGEVGVVSPSVPTFPGSFSQEGREVAAAYENGCAALAGRSGEQLTSGERGLLQTCSTLRSVSPAQAAELLDEAVPRIEKPAARIGIGAAQQQHQNITLRLTELRGAMVGPTIAASLIGADGQHLGGQQLAALLDRLSGGGASSDGADLGGRWGFFVNGSVGRGNRDTTQLEDGFDFDTSNLTAGVDYRVSDRLIVGAALGYADTDANFDSSPNETQVDGWSAILYGTYMPNEAAYIDAVISGARDQYDVRRRDPFTGLTAKGDTDGTAFSASLGGGYDLNRNQWTFGPYGRFSYAKADVDGYSESPVSGNEYRFDDQEAESVTLALGGRVSYAISTRYGVVVPQAWVDWTHEFSNDGELITARLINDPTDTPIGLRTDEPDRDYMHAGLAVSAQFAEGRAAFILYEGLFAHNYLSSGTLQAGLRLEF